MTLPSNDRLTDVMQDLEQLRAELAQLRRQQIGSIKNRWRLRIGLLATFLVIVASGAWSAQSADPALVDIEKRLSALESLIRKGPGDMTQVTGPLDVIGPDGKHILLVRNAGLEIINTAGNRVVYLGAGTDGDGTVIVSDAKGTDRAVIEGDGRIQVNNPQGTTVVDIFSGEKGGLVLVSDPKGIRRARMSGFGVINVFNANEKQVAAIKVGDDDRGRVAVVQNHKSVVEMTAAGNGNGYFYLADQQHVRSILSAGAFALFDKEGNGAVDLDAEQEDGGQVRVGNKKNMYRAVMGVNSAGGFVSVTDTKDALRAAMTGEGKVVVYDKDRNEVADMHVTPEGRGQVGVSVKDKLGVLMAADEKSGGLLMGFDAESHPRVVVSGSGEIVVYDKDINEAVGMHDQAEQGGRVTVMDKGKLRAAMGIGAENAGVLMAFNNKDGRQAAVLGTGALIVLNEKDVQVAGMTTSPEDGSGRVSIWTNDEKKGVLARLSADQGGSGGRLNIMNAAGTPVAQVRGGEKGGGGVRVANSAGMPYAEMVLTDDGRGMFRVNKGQNPIAVLTQAVDRPGGLVQISNFSGQSIANLTGGESGGYFQLTNSSGVSTVEGGTLPDGRGTVRAGPMFKCQSARTPLFSGGTGDCIVGASGGGVS